MRKIPFAVLFLAPAVFAGTLTYNLDGSVAISFSDLSLTNVFPAAPVYNGAGYLISPGGGFNSLGGLVGGSNTVGCAGGNGTGCGANNAAVNGLNFGTAYEAFSAGNGGLFVGGGMTDGAGLADVTVADTAISGSFTANGAVANVYDFISVGGFLPTGATGAISLSATWQVGAGPVNNFTTLLLALNGPVHNVQTSDLFSIAYFPTAGGWNFTAWAVGLANPNLVNGQTIKFSGALTVAADPPISSVIFTLEPLPGDALGQLPAGDVGLFGSTTPEPATMMVCGAGLLLIGLAARRFRKQ